MKAHKSTLNKELNKIIDEFFEDNEYIFHLLFQIIIVVCLVNFIDSISINDYQKLKFVFFLLVIILLFDYLIWTNSYQSMLFGLVLLGYVFYSRQQKDVLKEFYKNVVKKDIKQQRLIKNKKDKENVTSVTMDVDEQIPNPDVLDFEPDEIHSFDSEVKPFNNELSGKDNYIVDTLSKLPKVDYSNTEMGRKNQTILDALDDRHSITLNDHHKELARLNEFRKGKMLNKYKINRNLDKKQKHNKTTDEWNLDRYYPKCKTINDEPLYTDGDILLNNNDEINEEDENLSIINNIAGRQNVKNVKISNKMLNYCTNLPEVEPEQYEMISNNEVKLIYEDSPHIQICPKQYDIGGQGIVKKDFREKSSLV
jgi:hypothetical protein